MSRFIKAELKSDSNSESNSKLKPDSEADSKSDAELMAKLKSDSESHFTLNKIYSYVFVHFEEVILLLMAGHIKPFLFMPIFLRE